VQEAAVDLYKKLTGPAQPPVLPPTVSAVFHFYGKLVDKQTVIGMGTSTNQPLFFEVAGPLTKAELIYAIESTLKLNNIGIVPVDKTTIRTAPIVEALKLKTNSAPTKAVSPPQKGQ
jgi:hypothetical protein